MYFKVSHILCLIITATTVIQILKGRQDWFETGIGNIMKVTIKPISLHYLNVASFVKQAINTNLLQKF